MKVIAIINQIAVIIGVAIPVLASLIVATTKYPKVSGPLKTLMTILNAFSVMTHKDSPNTLKMPGTQSQEPKDNV